MEEEEEATETEFLVGKSIEMDFLTDNLLGLWVREGTVALRETKASICVLVEVSDWLN